MKGSRLLYAILFAALAAMAIAEEEGAKTEETPEPATPEAPPFDYMDPSTWSTYAQCARGAKALRRRLRERRRVNAHA